MVVYVQIGKNPRMAVNGKLSEIKADFIKQIPSWKKLVPVYFYPSSKTIYRTGALVPYTISWKNSSGSVRTSYYFYWVGECEYWDLSHGEGYKSKVRYGTVGWSRLMDVLKMYEKKGFTI